MTRLRLNLRTMSVNRALVYISPHLTSASALPGKPQRHRNRFPELERCISGVSFQVSNLHLFNVVNLRLILMPMNASLHLVINEVQGWAVTGHISGDIQLRMSHCSNWKVCAAKLLHQSKSNSHKSNLLV